MWGLSTRGSDEVGHLVLCPLCRPPEVWLGEGKLSHLGQPVPSPRPDFPIELTAGNRGSKGERSEMLRREKPLPGPGCQRSRYREEGHCQHPSGPIVLA